MHVSSVAAAAIFTLFKAVQVQADLHQILVGTYSTDFIYTIEFDDEAKTLSLLKNSSAAGPSAWLALSHDKKNLYGTDYSNGPYFYSYSLDNATSLSLDNTLAMNCSAKVSISVVASSAPPYAVYGNSWSGSDASCGVVMSVDSNGALSTVIQNFTYASDTGIHGTALNPEQTYLYSADDKGDSIWTHKIDNTTGEVTAIQRIASPSEGADPRHIAVHWGGLYAYSVMEAANIISEYTIDQITHELTYTNVSYSLLPSTVPSDSTDYIASDVVVSTSGTYAFATTRYSVDTSLPGYISGYKLSSNGSIESQLFIQATETSQGFSGSITVSPETDQWFALTDTITRSVVMYEWDGEVAEVVAELVLDDGGCCSNVVWYS